MTAGAAGLPRYTAGTVPVGVILFDFAADFEIAGLTVRWGTVALAGVIVLVVVVAAIIAARTQRPARSAAPGAVALSQEDLLLIVLSAVPGAIVGGRIGYVLSHLDYYGGHPSAILDPTQGSLELGLAVVGGTLTALVVAYGLGAPVGRWLHVAAIPLLLGIALGKLAMVLSGDGQGLPSDAWWATAYLGRGPWGSLAPGVPSHPAQLYEGGLTLLALVLLLALLATGRFRARDGRAYLAAIALWVVARVGVGFVWRDPAVLGPLGATQLIAVMIGIAASIGLLSWSRRARRPVEGGTP